MTATDIIALVITCIGVFSFATVITILYRNYTKSSISEIESGKRDIEIIDMAIYEANPKVRKRKKGWNITKTVIYYTFLAFIIPIFGLSIYSRIKSNVTMIGNNAVMVVASGSMSEKDKSNDYLYTFNLNNQFKTYDMITLTKVNNSSQLHLYDVIAYRNDKNINVIHRIIEIENKDGVITYTTRGDANNATDSYHPTFNDVIGKYTGKRIPVIGVFVMFFQSYAGIITVCSVVYCMFMISHYTRKSEEANEKRQQMLNEVFDITSLNEDEVEQMKSGYKQHIYYLGYEYTFDDKGFVDKRELSKEEQQIYQSNEITKVIEPDNNIQNKEE